MNKEAEIGLDFIIDKLTNSIENVITGDSFQTEISILLNSDLNSVTKKMVGFLIGMKNLKIQLEMFINLQFLETLKSFKVLLV
jgi:hypothetical protein